METYETLLYEEDDGVATVTLNRPEVHNVVDQQMEAGMRLPDWCKDHRARTRRSADAWRRRIVITL